MPDLWSLFGEMWTYPFMVRGIAVTLVAGIACAIVSCWLVLIGWSLMGDALSHAILPGVVIAYLLGLPFSIGAMAAGHPASNRMRAWASSSRPCSPRAS